MFSIKNLLYLLTPFALMADTLVYGPAEGDWGTTANWYNVTTSATNGALPGSTDKVIINQSKTVAVTTAAPGIDMLQIQNTNGSGNSATLNFNAGGSLTAGSVVVASNTDAGVLNVNGGSLTSNGGLAIGLAGSFNLASGSYTDGATGSRNVVDGNTTGDGSINISGGTFTAQGAAASHILRLRTDINISGGTFDMTGGQTMFDQGHDLNITGDGATINIDRLSYASGTANGNLNFTFNATGVSTITSATWVTLTNASIVVDGANYTGGAGEFTLISSTNMSAGPLSQSVINFDGFTTTLSQEGSNYVLSIVPEPTTSVLVFGLFIGLFVLKRLTRN